MAEIAFHFENKTAHALRLVRGLEGQELLCEREYSSACFSAAHSAEDRDTGEKASFRDRQPVRIFCGPGLAGIVDFANYQSWRLPVGQPGIRRQYTRADAAFEFDGKDIQSREQKG